MHLRNQSGPGVSSASPIPYSSNLQSACVSGTFCPRRLTLRRASRRRGIRAHNRPARHGPWVTQCAASTRENGKTGASRQTISSSARPTFTTACTSTAVTAMQVLPFQQLSNFWKKTARPRSPCFPTPKATVPWRPTPKRRASRPNFASARGAPSTQRCLTTRRGRFASATPWCSAWTSPNPSRIWKVMLSTTTPLRRGSAGTRWSSWATASAVRLSRSSIPGVPIGATRVSPGFPIARSRN